MNDFLEDKKLDLDLDLEPEEMTTATATEPETEEMTTETATETATEIPKNRREKRLRQRLDDERQSSKQLAEKLTLLAETSKNIEDSEYLKGIEKIYGNESPDAEMATNALKSALVGMGKDAEERAYQRFNKEREEIIRVEQEAKNQLEVLIDDIEDTYNIELSEAEENDFSQLLLKMSQKKDGKVVSYADSHSVWEVFKERTKRKPNPNTEAKAVSSRSLNQGGETKNTVADDSATRFLKENNII